MSNWDIIYFEVVNQYYLRVQDKNNINISFFSLTFVIYLLKILSIE